MDNQDELIAQFTNVTGASPATARGLLDANNWQLDEAVTLFYATQDGRGDDTMAEDPDAGIGRASHRPPSQTPAASASTGSSRQQPTKPAASKLRTLKDLQASSGGADDADSDEDDKQDFFAGGEKSALAVQNPNNPSDLIKSIINKARQNMPRPGGDDDDDEDDTPSPSNFTGPARTLGGQDTPSQLVQDPRQENDVPEPLPLVERTLHLWNEGFSVDDGDLYRFDDPANAAAVASINQGRAPQSILNVKPNQRVNLNLVPHKSNFVQPQKVYKPFGGSGQRLGSPVSAAASSSAALPKTTSSASASGDSQTPIAPSITIDESQPAISLQIRLGDGSRLTSRFNTTHTIGDVYRFVEASRPDSGGRAYMLMTTFPSNELSDRNAALADVNALSKGGVVVQKWLS